MFDKSYSDYYDFLNYDKDYKSEIEMIYKMAGKPKRILDVGCGTAFYWKYLPEGIQVCGIEKSINMILKSNYAGHIAHGDVLKQPNLEGYSKFDLVTALFDVMNYLPRHDWWYRLPLKKGGYFIFDIFDKRKVDRDGFLETRRNANGVERRIIPGNYDGRAVNLKILLHGDDWVETEIHKLYIYSQKEIETFAQGNFEIVKTLETSKWQTWYIIRKK